MREEEKPVFSPFPTMFSILSKRKVIISATSMLLFANAFYFDQAKILLLGKERSLFNYFAVNKFIMVIVYVRPLIIPSVRPSDPHFCPEHISKSISDINLKLHKWIDLIKEVCSVKEPLLYLHYFWSYCPLYIFFWNFCPEHISKSMKARNFKLHTHIELNEEACSAQDPLLCLQYF